MRTVYDDAGQATQQLVGVGVLGSSQQGVAVATFGYTANGRLQHLTDGEDNLTTYVYDGHDRLSRTRYPVTTQGAATSSTTDYQELGYDDNGNVTSLRLRDGTSIGFTVDALGRVTAENRPGSEADVTYAYDLLSRLTGASLSTGQNVSRGYDALGRLVSEGSYVSSHTNQYDAAGRRTRMTWSDGFYVDYDYLVTGEMTAIRENGATSGAGVLATFSYDSLGRRTSLTRGNGAVTTYGYDAVSRLDQLDEAFAGTTHDVNRTFAYNPASQIVQATRSNALFAFDVPANMNRVDTHNGLNQILQTDANATPPVDIDHDARGNITDDGPRTYTYDSRNRLTHSGGPSNTWLAYDALGRLLSIVPGGANHDYPHHDGWTIVSEYSGSAALRRRYVHGPGIDEPLVWYEGTGTNDRRWLHADERGSVIGVSDGTGAATSVNAYDEYGIPDGGITGRFGYTGQAWLPTIGIYHYRNRNYHPVLGRFMQPDPIGYGDGVNLYAYVGNDPTGFRDPYGTERICIQIPRDVGPGSQTKCVDVDFDGDKDTRDDDMSEYQRDLIVADFWGFIARYGGSGRSVPNLSAHGLIVWGNGNEHEIGMTRVTSQFIGAMMHFDNASWYDEWKTMNVFVIRNRGFVSNLTGSTYGLYHHESRTIIVTGLRHTLGGSIYNNPTDLARIVFHEALHRFWPRDLSSYQHGRLDATARSWIMRHGLGGGGCAAIGSILSTNYPGC